MFYTFGFLNQPNFLAAEVLFHPVVHRGTMGHRSGDAPSPLQQLREKILQAVPALPPELQKQLEVENAGPMGDRWAVGDGLVAWMLTLTFPSFSWWNCKGVGSNLKFADLEIVCCEHSGP